MFVTAEPVAGLRSLADVRRGVESGHASELWQALLSKVNEEMEQDVWTPASAVSFRSASSIEQANREFVLVAMTANRIMDAALAGLITGDRRYAEAALHQMDALFDPAQWPDWEDKAHVNAGLKVDLRHGQLASAVALAYDWMYGLLDESERARIVEGLDRCAIQRYKAAVAAEEIWTRRQNNWMTVIVGGFGIVGMALGEDHPDSAWLIEYAQPKMDAYLDILGPEGEFNESVQYAGSMLYVMRYYMARLYASGGRDNLFERRSLSDFCRWYMSMTFPPGRVAGFGDPAPDMPPVVSYFSAVAAATRDPVLQWFYLQYADAMLETHRKRALELLYYDASLAAEPPAGRLPLGRAYHAQGKLVSSRSSWDPLCTPSVVYAKAGREDNHNHADWGQVCIDGYGDRLVIDLGSPPTYPKDHKERYYNYQQWGHNVLVLGDNDSGGVSWLERKRQGRIVRAEFDDKRGSTWTMDLTEAYDNATHIERTVVHLLPRVAVVLDLADLGTSQPLSMRWHTVAPPELDADGGFFVLGQAAALACRVQRVDGPAVCRIGRQEYVAPYNEGRLGEPFTQRHEPYVEARATDDTCRLISLFCVFGPDDSPAAWVQLPEGWSIQTPEGSISVRIAPDKLIVRNVVDGRAWEATVGAAP
jgi:hypothetical protein